MPDISSLPNPKWGGVNEEAILLGDFIAIETAILQLLGLTKTPTLQYVDATSTKVAASTDSPTSVMMLGFPDVVNPGQFITGGLTDSTYRQNTADAAMDFDVAASLWGTEKASQWYAIYAIEGDPITSFDLKAMPIMRVKSQATQTISLGTNVTPATGIGYGFTTDELVGASIYFISGASKGLIRPITANNNDSTTGGTVTYSGTALTVAAGDWFIVLPATNFRLLGYIFNDASSNLGLFTQDGNEFSFSSLLVNPTGTYENVTLCPPTATQIFGSYHLVMGAGESVAIHTKDACALLVGTGSDSTEFSGAFTWPTYAPCTVKIVGTVTGHFRVYVHGYKIPGL